MKVKATAALLALLCVAAAGGFAAAALNDDLVSTNRGRAAFAQPFAFVKDEALGKFRSGAAIFRQAWLETQGDDDPRFGGLGPLSNRLSCLGCHIGNGRGETSVGETDMMRSTLVRLSVPGSSSTGEVLPEPAYGDQLQTAGIYRVQGEGTASLRWREFEQEIAGSSTTLRRPELVFSNLHYGAMSPDTLTSVRMSPAVFGLGLLDAVPDAELMSLADPDDRNGDGIRGRVNRVWNAETKRTVIGRFGLKANQPTLRQQVASALIGDMGITSPVFLRQNCTQIQKNCLAAVSKHNPEISDIDFETLVSYIETLAPPGRRGDDPQAIRGETVFEQIGCTACHTPTLKTGNSAKWPQISDRDIHPYTDLLLHDMGDGLADGRPDFEASGRDWRTAPLWGIGLAPMVQNKPAYLHDGRARDLNEAVLWHGGEAERTRNAYAALAQADRTAIIAFLNTL